MVCSKCGKSAFRAYSYHDMDGRWHSFECEDCYPLGKVMGFTAVEKIKSRILAPDGRTVLQGREGLAFRKRQTGKT